MTTTIIEFWKNNRSFWITHPSKQKEVDKIISDKFFNYDWTIENLIGKIIYLDQFTRHFQRLGLITESRVSSERVLSIDIIKHNINSLKDFDEIEIIFALMPFKHLKQYDFIFDYLHNTWLPKQSTGLNAFPDLQKFYIDTYKKAFTLETVKSNLITEHILEPYDASLICDYYPELYTSSVWNIVRADGNKLLPFLKNDKKVIVSLSGGVDSMVMLTLLKYINDDDVCAVHIIYGNRKESEHEYRLLAEFCNKLQVPLFVYRIKWLRRGYCDRQFYEDMTRELRFLAYKAASSVIGAEEPCVMMGHIKDDVIENVWTNIAHCHHLGNLKKMEAEEVQLGVRIMRPLLTVDKADIYRVSEKIGIPYFKNTTPNWSNRGKFREHFHNATITQFGESVDEKIIEFAEAIQSQASLLNMLLYDPIYNSFKDNTINITTAFKANLDANSWLSVFETICHKYLGIARPSIKSVRDFCMRLYKPWEKLNVEMGKGLKIKVIKTKDSQYIMEFILV
jgi:tRNA(Ile)-lysidine synthetase-like protein